jgi:cyclopropane-fatty-acyl-phospholipid synthase
MIEELTPNIEMSLPKSRDWKTAVIKWGARNLLRWHPIGSLLVRLPSGEELRFGIRSGVNEPLLKLKNYNVLTKSIRRGTIGFAEAYINGDIECEDLTGLIRFFIANQERFEKTGSSLFKVRLPDRIAHLIKRNSRKGSRRNISDHYDLGNEFFKLWLDPKMVYSSAYFAKGAQTLEEAQNAKINLILEMLNLRQDQDLLEIGCGWGSLANVAANNFKSKVKAITLSQEQLSYSQEKAYDLKLKPLFVLEDYRDTKGEFDHIVSIEMIEAVGESYWGDYFETLHDRLKPGGSAVVQAITIDENRYDQYRQQADFIQRYIFPGGMLPTKTIIEQRANSAGLRLEKRELFGQCYARTLFDWRLRFEAAWPEIAELGFDDKFRRTWRYYLAYCEAGFAEGLVDVGVYQLRK